jgi:hypothetical protein
MKTTIVQIGDGHVMGHMVKREDDGNSVKWYRGLKYEQDEHGNIIWNPIPNSSSLEEGFLCGIKWCSDAIGIIGGYS